MAGSSLGAVGSRVEYTVVSLSSIIDFILHVVFSVPFGLFFFASLALWVCFALYVIGDG
jgi:hypothetical protein